MQLLQKVYTLFPADPGGIVPYKLCLCRFHISLSVVWIPYYGTFNLYSFHVSSKSMMPGETLNVELLLQKGQDIAATS